MFTMLPLEHLERVNTAAAELVITWHVDDMRPPQRNMLRHLHVFGCFTWDKISFNTRHTIKFFLSRIKAQDQLKLTIARST